MNDRFQDGLNQAADHRTTGAAFEATPVNAAQHIRAVGREITRTRGAILEEDQTSNLASADFNTGLFDEEAA